MQIYRVHDMHICAYIYTYVTTFDSTKIPVTLDNVPNKSAGSLHQLGAKKPYLKKRIWFPLTQPPTSPVFPLFP